MTEFLKPHEITSQKYSPLKRHQSEYTRLMFGLVIWPVSYQPKQDSQCRGDLFIPSPEKEKINKKHTSNFPKLTFLINFI